MKQQILFTILATTLLSSGFNPANAAEAFRTKTDINEYNISQLGRFSGMDFEQEEYSYSNSRSGMPQVGKGAEQWGNYFVYISASGEKTVIQERNSADEFIPASTLKILTSYNAYVNSSMNLQDLSVMLHNSNNALAEKALTSLASTRTAAINKVYKSLEDLAVSDTATVVDGSGYSTSNKLSPLLLGEFLEKIYLSGDYDNYKELLAQPKQFGTLEKSFNEIDTDPTNSLEDNINIYAKTGTLPTSRVKSLAGYAETENGVLIFSVMANNVNADAAKIKIEKMVSEKILSLKAEGKL